MMYGDTQKPLNGGVTPVRRLYSGLSKVGNMSDTALASEWLPLAPAQLDFWEEYTLHPGQTLSTVAHCTELCGAVEEEALCRAIAVTLAETQAFALRFGERRAAQIGLAASVSGYTAFALVTSPVLALITLVLLAPGSLVQPSLSAMLSQRMPPDAQGEAQGIGGSGMALGSVVAPLLYNPALAWFTSPAAPFRWPGAPFVIAVGFGLLTFLILTQVPRRAVQMPPATGG